VKSNSDPYRELMAFQRQTEALGQVAGRLGWDQETQMPPGAAEQRGEEMAALEGVLHARRTDPRIADWLARAEPADAVAAAQLRQIARVHARMIKVPARLAEELARVTSVAQGVWATARAENDVASFLPTLRAVVDLKREEAQALAQGGDVYDALVDDFEPGMTAADIAAMFGAMRPRLVALREAILGAAHQPAPLTGRFKTDVQMALARDLATAFGYDWNRGKLDLSVHPFSSGSGQDVRITTRVVEADPLNCFYSTIHEVGHACYELAIEPAYGLTALGAGVSMGVHESQSRIYENQLGRSRAFTGFIFGKIRERMGDFGTASEDDFYAAVNRVHSGFIRTEADEVHYNLHVMLRFDLERDLIRGALEVGHLEEAWNVRFSQDFGANVPSPAFGILQDVHWSSGAFGYFPTYSLGNLYAGCLFKSLKQAVPDWDAHLARGEAAAVTAWLHEAVQRHGSLRLPRETIVHATGEEPSAEPFLAYLEAKFGEIYRL